MTETAVNPSSAIFPPPVFLGSLDSPVDFRTVHYKLNGGLLGQPLPVGDSHCPSAARAQSPFPTGPSWTVPAEGDPERSLERIEGKKNANQDIKLTPLRIRFVD